MWARQIWRQLPFSCMLAIAADRMPIVMMNRQFHFEGLMEVSHLGSQRCLSQATKIGVLSCVWICFKGCRHKPGFQLCFIDVLICFGGERTFYELWEMHIGDSSVRLIQLVEVALYILVVWICCVHYVHIWILPQQCFISELIRCNIAYQLWKLGALQPTILKWLATGCNSSIFVRGYIPKSYKKSTI